MIVYGRMNEHSAFRGEVMKTQRILPKVTQDIKRRNCPLNPSLRVAQSLCIEIHYLQNRGYMCIQELTKISFINLRVGQNQEREIWWYLLVSRNWFECSRLKTKSSKLGRKLKHLVIPQTTSDKLFWSFRNNLMTSVMSHYKFQLLWHFLLGAGAG